MKERPIIFNGEMIKAILDGRKTQTRRVLKKQPLEAPLMMSNPRDGWVFLMSKKPHRGIVAKCRYGGVGDRLWVRETFCIESSREVGPYQSPFSDGRPWRQCEDEAWGNWWEQPHYKATDPTPELEIGTGDPGVKWSPSIHMPRWASRITLEIVNVRVERVQKISETDAKAEGCEASRIVEMSDGSPCYTDTFRELWQSIHGIDNLKAWNNNPWVWAIEFKVIDATGKTVLVR